jgi:hypothetical protein
MYVVGSTTRLCGIPISLALGREFPLLPPLSTFPPVGPTRWSLSRGLESNSGPHSVYVLEEMFCGKETVRRQPELRGRQF